MTLNKKWLIMLVTTTLLLVSCGSSIESKLVGSSWKVVVDDHITTTYLEIGEERIINRSQSNDSPMTVEYILTETQDENFMIEIINPDNGSAEFFFEGHFEDNDTITIVRDPNGVSENSELIRVDNITEEIEAEEKRRQEEREIEAENTLEEKELGAVETIQTSELHSNRDTYFQKVFVLEQEILTEAQQLYAHDIPHGFYGQYYSDWDDLLQEVWDVLKETMPIEEFELIKSEQIQWIEMKEQNFAEMPDENASARAEGMDYLVHITTERVVYLIENFMD